MRYLRMLTNSLLAGALGAGFVGVIILQLNPHLQLSTDVIFHLGARLWLFYGVNLAVLFYALVVLAQVLSRDGLSPGWLSLRLLAWCSTLVAGSAAALMWVNVRGFAAVLAGDSARRMAAGAAATSVCAGLLLIIAVVHYSFGRRGSRVGGTLYALTVGAGLLLPLAARGWGGDYGLELPQSTSPVVLPEPATRRVELLLLDGASLDFITPITAAGRLPNFARLLEEGATMHVTTLRPTQPGPVWASAMTGKYPPASGVQSASRYEFGVPRQPITLLPDLCLAHAMASMEVMHAIPYDGAAFRSKPLWRILSDAGISVGVVGVPLTHPAPPVEGYVVSDRLHLLSNQISPYNETNLVFPPELLGILPDDMFEQGVTAAPQGPGQGPLPRDVFYRRAAAIANDRVAARVRIVRYEGTDVAGHHYLRYAMPGAFGDVSAEERQRLGQVLEQQYALIDAELGAAMQRMDPDDLLMVVSGFGMEPQSVGKRLLGQLLREPELPGTHERAPEGFLMAWGREVARGRRPVGAIVDVTPTVLYYAGLPIARDMDGIPRTDMFSTAFTADRPLTYIPSYGN